jgi:hypothetical protein
MFSYDFYRGTRRWSSQWRGTYGCSQRRNAWWIEQSSPCYSLRNCVDRVGFFGSFIWSSSISSTSPSHSPFFLLPSFPIFLTISPIFFIWGEDGGDDCPNLLIYHRSSNLSVFDMNKVVNDGNPRIRLPLPFLAGRSTIHFVVVIHISN